MRRLLSVFSIFLILSLALPVSPACADAIYLKEKKVLKGVVVEERPDRYILSTIDGEIPVLKLLIESVKYDDPEQSYYQLGRQLQRAGRLKDALAAYDQAVKIKPEFKAAREAAFNVQRLLWKDDKSDLQSEISQKKFLLERAGKAASPAPAAASKTLPPKSLEQRFGFNIAYDSGVVYVIDVRPETPAGLAGLQPNDRVVAVWGEPLDDLEMDAISRQFHLGGSELSMTVERRAILQKGPSGKDPWGFKIDMIYDGLVVKEVSAQGPAAGILTPGDAVVSIEGHSARYMSISHAQSILKTLSSAGSQATLTLRKTVSIRERTE